MVQCCRELSSPSTQRALELRLGCALPCHPCSALPALLQTDTLTCFRKRSAWGPSCGSASRMNCITSSTVQHEGSRLLSRVPSRYRSAPGAQHSTGQSYARPCSTTLPINTERCCPHACSSTCSRAFPFPTCLKREPGWTEHALQPPDGSQLWHCLALPPPACAHQCPHVLLPVEPSLPSVEVLPWLRLQGWCRCRYPCRRNSLELRL